MADITELNAAIIKQAVERNLALAQSQKPTPSDLALLCFAETRNQNSGWMLHDDDERFRAGCAALYLLADDETKEQITRELRIVRALSAAVSGVPVNFDALGDPDPDSMLGLMGLFRESAERVR